MASCTDGLAPTFYHVIDLEKAFSIGNSHTSNVAQNAYVTNAKVEAVLLKQKDR